MDTLFHTVFTRRSALQSAAGSGLAAAVVPSLNFLASPAEAANYRGVVGIIKPRANDSALVDMIKLLPEGIGVIPVYLNLTQGSREEYGSKVRFVPAEPSQNERAPDLRVLAGNNVEIGAAWKRMSKENTVYHSVKLDDPSFPAPIYANLVAVDDGYALVWSR